MSQNTKTVKKQKEEAFTNINTKSFVVVVIMLIMLLFVSGAMSYFIPQGLYERTADGAIVPGTYVKSGVKGIAISKILLAPFKLFATGQALTVIMISLFLLIMSGVFNLMDKTGGMKVFIGWLVKRFEKRKRIVILVTVLTFMMFGSFFGMFEELVALLPIILVFMLSLGFDTLTGLGVCMLSSCFGFSAAITNPFSVGLAAGLAKVHIFDGVWLRLIFFAFIYASVVGFLLLHIKRITADPQKSLTYESDRMKLIHLDSDTGVQVANGDRLLKAYGIFFVVQLFLLIMIASIRKIAGYAIPILAATFLIGGIIVGLLTCVKKSDAFKFMAQGAVAMLPAVLMIILASSVKVVMDESGIMDTVIHYVITYLKDKGPFISVLLIYVLILFLQIFIGSASAKIMLIMPFLLAIAPSLNISPALIILTYCIADGFTDVILPTNPVLLIGLSMANVSYGKWVRWTWWLQLFVLAFTVLLLYFATVIGY